MGRNVSALVTLVHRIDVTSADSHLLKQEKGEEKHSHHSKKSYPELRSTPPKHSRTRRDLSDRNRSHYKTFREYLPPTDRGTISSAQLRLLRATLAPELPKNISQSTDRTNELACPRNDPARTGQHDFASFDDMKNCRFRPSLRGRKHVEADEEDGTDANRITAFIRRMEGSEKVRREHIDRMRAEKAYCSQIDKKECPKCGNPQSYAEVKQKRNKCPNCNETYRARIVWDDIASSFLKKLDAESSSKAERKQNKEFCLNQTPRSRKWHEVEDEFLGRVYLDMARRQSDHSALLRESQKQCTFHPVICKGSQKAKVDSFQAKAARDLQTQKHKFRKDARRKGKDSTAQLQCFLH